MLDPNFARTVVLLCDYNEEGALGIIVNRTIDVAIEEVLDQMDVPRDGAIRGPVLWGGPVQPGAVFLTFGGDSPAVEEGEDTPVFSLASNLHVSPARDIIEAVAGSPDGPPAFISLGYAGWAPGQLDGEIRQGAWIFLDVDADVVFTIPPEKRYDYCLSTLGVSPHLLWMQPVDE
jgi:putative transcriptional regulator